MATVSVWNSIEFPGRGASPRWTSVFFGFTTTGAGAEISRENVEKPRGAWATA